MDRGELRRLLDAATPGPWRVFDSARPGIDQDDPMGSNVVYASTFTCPFGGVGRKEDADLIVAAATWGSRGASNWPTATTTTPATTPSGPRCRSTTST